MYTLSRLLDTETECYNYHDDARSNTPLSVRFNVILPAHYLSVRIFLVFIMYSLEL